MSQWTEFTFMLKPSSLGGIGVFATHDVPTGTPLFSSGYVPKIRKTVDIPEAFRKYCIYINDEECAAPERFDRMEIGWFINHSHQPNIHKADNRLIALHDLKANEEILLDYNSLNEPEHLKEAYYINIKDEREDERDANEMVRALKETDKRKDEFLAVLAHELRNPLVPIKNALHLLQNTENSVASTRRLIQMIERQINHIVRLVDDLMEVSRITTGKIELRKEKINLIDVINNAIEVSKPLLDSKQHRLVWSLQAASHIVYADMVRMTQVFANLLNNAAKFTPNNGIITVNATQQNNHVVISVKDSGVGISAEMLPNVFELFAQDKNNVDPANKGLGVGLAMVRNLVELHEGSVKALSAGHHRGSEFAVSLPLDKNEKDIAVHPNTLEKNYSLNYLRVLIVDDNHDITSSFAMVLESWDMNVRAVNDSNSALAAIDEFNPHIVLLDIGMPEMDGYQLAEKIRQNRKYDAITLVALTGWSQEKDREKSHASGFNEHLAKPVDFKVLKELFTSFIENKLAV